MSNGGAEYSIDGFSAMIVGILNRLALGAIKVNH